MDDVFAAGDRGLREVMVPRTEVDFLPGDMPAHKAVREVLQGAALALSGDGRVGRRHHRLRPRPRPARSRGQQPDHAGVGPGPAGAVAARHRPGAAGADRHAARAAATWRSCWTSTAARPASSPWRTWSRSWSATSPTSTTWWSSDAVSVRGDHRGRRSDHARRVRRADRASSCPRDRTTPLAGFFMAAAAASCPSSATRSRSTRCRPGDGRRRAPVRLRAAGDRARRAPGRRLDVERCRPRRPQTPIRRRPPRRPPTRNPG